MEKYDFYLIIAPGLIDLATKELEEKWQQVLELARRYDPTVNDIPLDIENQSEGLVLKQLPLLPAVLLNTYLKIPTRILLRIASFRCRDFPKLYNKCKKINWKPWFGENPVKIKVSAKRSRLMMLKRIEDSVLKGIGSKPAAEAKHTLYVRFEDDTCTLSIDTSGEPLYKRTPDKKVSEAPLRETLAAALIYEVMREGGKDAQTFIDPMVGAGTTLREVATFWNTHSRTEYSFLDFAGLPDINPDSLSDHALGSKWQTSLKGFDKSAKAVASASANLGSDIKIAKHDVFVPTSPLEEDTIIFVNPPYGERIKLGTSKTTYFTHLWEAIATSYAPKIAGIIVPRREKKYFSVSLPYAIKSTRDFLNGGLKVTFILIKLK